MKITPGALEIIKGWIANPGWGPINGMMESQSSWDAAPVIRRNAQFEVLQDNAQWYDVRCRFTGLVVSVRKIRGRRYEVDTVHSVSRHEDKKHTPHQLAVNTIVKLVDMAEKEAAKV